MSDALISLNLSADWITKLSRKLISISQERKEEIEKIRLTLGNDISPLQLPKYYVPSRCQEVNPADFVDEGYFIPSNVKVFDMLEYFIQHYVFKQPGNNQMFILADVGMGKTALLTMFKLIHLTSFIPKTEYDCVLKKLGPTTLEELENIRGGHRTILLLDALDEDPAAYGRVEKRLEEILEATRSFYRVVITSRTQFFPDVKEDPLRRPGFIHINGFICPRKYLSFFDEEEIALYLSKIFHKERFIKRKKKIKEAKNLLVQMGNLKRRPLLLSYIDDLLESPWSGRNDSEYDIYQALIKNWLIREHNKIKEQYKVVIPEETLLKACKILASQMHLRELNDISEEDLDRLVSPMSMVDVIKKIGEVIKQRSLLNRNSDGNYLFSHFSVQEFLVAKRIIEDSDFHPDTPVRPTPFLIQLLLKRGNLARNLKFFNLKLIGLPNFDLKGLNFSDCDLHGISFSKANIENTNFTRANLKGADLFGADLRKAILNEATLEGANLSKAKLNESSLFKTNFSGANLSKANLNGLDLSMTDLTKADLSHASLENVNLSNRDFRGANLTQVNFKKADLKGADFTGMDLKKINFGDANLKQAKFNESDLSRKNLSGLDFTGVDFRKAIMKETNLKGAKLRGAKFQRANLYRADLSNTNLNEKDFENASLRETNFEGASLIKANFKNAKLNGANFSKAVLKNVIFDGAVLSGVDFSETNLKGMDFSGMNLKGVKFIKAILSEANFNNADLTDANFQDANTLGMTFKSAITKGTNFKGTVCNVN
jgi:uncharacterized protein YjbI with pentapeptide repeats